MLVPSISLRIHNCSYPYCRQMMANVCVGEGVPSCTMHPPVSRLEPSSVSCRSTWRLMQRCPWKPCGAYQSCISATENGNKGTAKGTAVQEHLGTIELLQHVRTSGRVVGTVLCLLYPLVTVSLVTLTLNGSMNVLDSLRFLDIPFPMRNKLAIQVAAVAQRAAP